MQSYNEQLKFSLSLKWVISFLIIIPVILSVMNFLANPFIDPANYTFWGGQVYELFALDHEQNLPTWYSTILLFMCGLLCLVIGRLERETHKKQAIWWLCIGLAFVFLSADESAGFHEPIAEFLRHHNPLHFKGIFRGAWIFPYLLIVAIILPFFIKQFLLKIPRRLAVLMALAGVLFFTGAVGFEMVGGAVWDGFHEKKQFWYQMTVFAEEMLEIAGTSLFAGTLINHINKKKMVLSIP